uniref:Acid phosphatase n=1 Tax=Onchocerca volvulus TaxID=6282 RepID=A0A2K6VKV0_ONCVO
MLIILVFLIISGFFDEKWISSTAFSNLWNETEIENLVNSSTTQVLVGNEQRSKPELIFVHVLWRHGDRGPMKLYPNDPNKESMWPNGLGELTEIGMQQLFKVGKSFYERYINRIPPFLSKNYNNREIYIRSTDVNRTITSAMAVLAGMFRNGIAGKDYPKESNEINWPRGWIPIPVHTVELKHDHIGYPFHQCKRAELLEKEAFQSNNFRKITAMHQELLKYLSNMTGYKDLQLNERFNSILDTLTIERFHNLKVPEWFTEKVEKEMRFLRAEIRKNRYGNAKYFGSSGRLIRLRGGAILNAIIDKLRQKWKCLNNDSTECVSYKNIKFYGLSAHDVTISALFAALRIKSEITDIGDPEYGATVYFELYKFNNEPYVKFLYSKSYLDEPKSVTNSIRECPAMSDLCPLEKFIMGQKDYLPTNIRKECYQNMQKHFDET